jgi:hypothetical protein
VCHTDIQCTSNQAQLKPRQLALPCPKHPWMLPNAMMSVWGVTLE